MEKRYFIYCRKSTDEEDRQVLSLSAQKNEIHEFVKKSSLKIGGVFEESQSARSAGRPKFNQMMSLLEKGKAGGVIVHKMDRLTRNLWDTARISDLMAKGKEFIAVVGGTYANDARGQFFFGIESAMAKFYVDNLSEEIRKGMREKVRQGGWPGKVPIGYRKSNGEVQVDPETAPFVRKAFELYATGACTLPELAKELSQEGMRTRSGNSIHVSNLHRILTRDFYCGDVIWNGKRFGPGNHAPLVERTLFEQVQQRLHRKHPSHSIKHYFTYRGFLVCGECGCAITAETQKGHIYYHCTKSKGRCSQRYLREEGLEAQVVLQLRQIAIDKRAFEVIKAGLKESHQQEEQLQKDSLAKVNRELERIRDQRHRLFDLYVQGKAPEDLYQEKIAQLRDTEGALAIQVEAHRKTNNRWFEAAEQFLELSHKVDELFLNAEPEDKRRLLQTVASNGISKDRKVVLNLKKPFDVLLGWQNRRNWWSIVNVLRTWFARQPEWMVTDVSELVSIFRNQAVKHAA